jgi:hypothetical protein
LGHVGFIYPSIVVPRCAGQKAGKIFDRERRLSPEANFRSPAPGLPTPGSIALDQKAAALAGFRGILHDA